MQTDTQLAFENSSPKANHLLLIPNELVTSLAYGE